MSQNFTEDLFAANHVGLTDLQNIEDSFNAVATLFSGSSAPPNSTGGRPWFDTGNKILKIRNSTNGAWLGVHYSSTVPRFWVYGHNAEDGWLVDTTVSDRVVSIKGGSQAYNVVGGNLGGSWTIAGYTVGNESVDHTHYAPDHSHTFGSVSVLNGSSDVPSTPVYCSFTDSGGAQTGTESCTHTHSLTYDATWRPAAAVGTLQYLSM